MGIIVFGEGDLPLTKFIHIIHQLEKVRDADFLGTSIHAVAAGGAGNGFFRGNDFGDLFHKLPFFIRERLETVHVREIILHLGVVMPDSTIATLGRLAANRTAQDAIDWSGRAFFSSFSASVGTLDSRPPLTGSMTSTGLLCLTAVS